MKGINETNKAKYKSISSMNIVIHKSPVLLAFKIIILEVLIELVYLIIGGIAFFLGQQLGYELRLVSPLTQLLLLVIQIGVLIFMLTRWGSETYEIQADEIIIKYGFLKRIEKAYPYRNMQSVIVRQTVIERLVGAGTVSVFVPTLGAELLFTEVPDPKVFAEGIKKAMPDTGNSQFILRK